MMLTGNRSKYVHSVFASHLSILLSVFACLLLGIATPLSAQVTSAQPSVNFGSASFGASTTQSVSIASVNALATVNVLTQGIPSLDFTSTTGTTCTTGTVGACTVVVQFQPTAVGRRLGAVVVSDGTNSLTVPLLGVGNGSLAAFGPGLISTFAGNGTFDSTGDGGPATSATLGGPKNVAFDGGGNLNVGNLYISENNANKVRMVTPSGIISTVAGTGIATISLATDGDGGPATNATLNNPYGVAVDGAGNLYIADSGDNVVRMVNKATGIITTVAGGATTICAAPQSTDSVGDGCLATNATLNNPIDVAVDGQGNLYIADSLNNAVRMVNSAGIITTVAGVPALLGGFTGDGGPATSALLNNPVALEVDASGNLYIADQANNAVRMVSSGTMTTVAGILNQSGYAGDGAAAISANLNGPSGVKMDAAGDLYISDWYNQVIRKVIPSGVISTIVGVNPSAAGAALGSYSGDGGPATSATLSGPFGIALDGGGNLYIADYNNYRVRKVDVSDAPAVAFATTTVKQTSAAQDVSIMNLGNVALTIGSISTPTDFTFGGSDTTCNVGGQGLNAGANCVLGIEFNPQTPVSLSESVVIADTSVSGTSQTIGVSGTGSGLLAQTINFPNPGTLTYGVGPITLAAQASSSLAVTYTVTSGPATVNGSVLTITGAGSVTVKATQNGSASYTAATPVSVTFVVNPEVENYKIAASTSAVSIAAGANGQATFTLTSTNYAGTVSFTTSVTTTNGTASAVTATATPVTLAAGGTGTSTITIATTSSAANHAPAVPWKSGGAVMFCAVLLGAPFTIRRKRAIAGLLVVLAISLAAFLIACGGGSSSKTTTPTPAARTYTVTATPAATAPAPAGATSVTNAAAVTITVTVQ